MKIRALDLEPFDTLTYFNAGRRGSYAPTELPLLAGLAQGLPGDVEALIVASDLQGRTADDEGLPGRLLGHDLAEHLEFLGEIGELPPAERTGVILAGDLYTVPGLTRRGGLGDVRSVWRAFSSRFRWVAGVAGNHDWFADSRRDWGGADRFRRRGAGHLLDGDQVELDGLTIGGVSGIVGDPRQPQRKQEDDFLGAIGQALPADVLVLHEGPGGEQRSHPGNPAVTELVALHEGPPLLVICGHRHWDDPLAELSADVQILNVDARCVVLTG